MLEPTGFTLLIKADYEKDVDLGDGRKLYVEESRRNGIAAVDTGILVAVGPTAWRSYDDGRAWANVGDRVAYAKYGGRIVEDPDTREELILLNDGDVRCKIIQHGVSYTVEKTEKGYIVHKHKEAKDG